jgi:hypothetical protein
MAVVRPAAKAIPPTVKPTAKVAPKVATKVAPKVDGFQVVDMSTITLAPKAGGGGGKALSPFAVKVFSLENGQGFKITEERYGDKGKGIASVYAGAARRNMKLRVRRDMNGQLWLFRISAEDEAEAIARKEQRLAEQAEAEAVAE